MKSIRGKQLKEGMWVVVSWAAKWASIHATAVPIKVVVVQYPCVIFEVVRPAPPSAPAFMAMIHNPDEKAIPAYQILRHTFASNVRWCRFQEVSEEYVEAYNRAAIPVEEPGWLNDPEAK